MVLPPDQAFALEKGQRAFEIALARRIEAGDTESDWFRRHDSTPITELPGNWPDEYRQVVERRPELIESDRFVDLLERPEYKRRWNWDTWQNLAERGLSSMYRGTPDVDLVDLIDELLQGDAVPYLASWRYKDTGLRKRASWEKTWDLQRRQDAGENVGKIPVPPIEVGRLPLHHHLEGQGQARRAQGALRRLPRRRALHRHHP